MVHALKELWRVLAPRGMLIDLRPLCVDVPLLILTSAECKSAGLVDRGEERIHDNAADRATRGVLQEGLFTRLKLVYFAINFYWNDLEEFTALLPLQANPRNDSQVAGQGCIFWFLNLN